VAKLATVGVYESDLEAFLDALAKAGVTLVIDVRQRRGVRGPQYAWANSARLQAALADAGIGYRHRRDLAPTTELRRLQYAEDAKAGVGKRSRRQLATEYVRRYNEEILDAVDLGELVQTLAADGATALLCVERDAEACHRSLIAQRIATEHDVAVIHLRP
jgi:uncharacterized protein (DUF488 family)